MELGRRAMSLLLLACLGALISAAAAGSQAASTGAVQTLLDVPRPIHAFGQDGGRIAWVNRINDVVVRDVAGGRSTVIGSLWDGDLGCRDADECGVTLAGDRAVFWITTGAMNLFTTAYTASVAHPGRKKVAALQAEPDTYDGDHLIGPSGDASDLVFGITSGNTPSMSYDFTVTGGYVKRVVGNHTKRIPGLGPAALLDVAAGRLAVVPAKRGSTNWIKPVVEIRDARSGALLRTIRLAGTPRAVALSRTVVAVVINAKSQKSARVERYDAATGRRLGTTTFALNDPGLLVDDLDAMLGIVVYHSQSTSDTRVYTISMVDSGGRWHRLARTRGEPVGVSIEGWRVAWGENSGKRAYVRAVTVG